MFFVPISPSWGTRIRSLTDRYYEGTYSFARFWDSSNSLLTVSDETGTLEMSTVPIVEGNTQVSTLPLSLCIISSLSHLSPLSLLSLSFSLLTLFLSSLKVQMTSEDLVTLTHFEVHSGSSHVAYADTDSRIWARKFSLLESDISSTGVFPPPILVDSCEEIGALSLSLSLSSSLSPILTHSNTHSSSLSESLEWSHDGDWLAISCLGKHSYFVIKLFHFSTHTLHNVTAPFYHSTQPKFSPDDRWIFFLSTYPIAETDRVGAGGTVKQASRLFVIALTSEFSTNPFQHPSELSPMISTAFGFSPIPYRKYSSERMSRYQLDNIEYRMFPIPFCPPLFYSNIFLGNHSNTLTVYVTHDPHHGVGDGTKSLMSIDIPSHPYLMTPNDITTLSTSIHLITVSSDGSLVAAVMKSQGSSQRYISLLRCGEKEWKYLDLSSWKFSLTPWIEWKQVCLNGSFQILHCFFCFILHSDD